MNKFELGVCNKGAHSIPTLPNAPPILQKQFPLAIKHEKEVRRQVLEWLKIWIIRPSQSNWNSSSFLVKKKVIPWQPQTWRVVQDLHCKFFHGKFYRFCLCNFSHYSPFMIFTEKDFKFDCFKIFENYQYVSWKLLKLFIKDSIYLW